MSSTPKLQRFEGEVDRWLGKFGFISYTDSGVRKRIYCSTHTTRPDWKGSRAWVFGERIPVIFGVGQRLDSKSSQICACAIDVAPVFPMSEPQSLSDYRETSIVRKKEHAFLFLERPCGDVTFLHLSDVLPQYQSRWELLKEGAPVWHAMRHSEGRNRWFATDAELYSAEELEQFFNPTEEPESAAEFEPAEPELAIETEERFEPELETVLAPATRNKTLLQLVIEKRARY
jgi:hypothetical protein